MSNLEEFLLKDVSIFSPWIEMSDVDWTCITKEFTAKFFKKNTAIYHQEDTLAYVYLVKSGRVCLDIFGFHGENRSLFIATQGAFFGELAPIDLLPNLCSAKTVSDSWIYVIPKQRFLKELDNNHKFSLDVLRLMSKKMRLISTQVKQLSFNNSYYRVCYALTNLVNQYGVKTTDGYRLRIKFTHQEMASLTGLSRVSVSNIFLDMTANQIIDKQDGYLLIKDMDALRLCINKNT